MTEAVEITTFRLADGVDMEGFIAANADINAWLKTQPGFLSRRICQREDGIVVDMLIWASAQDGHRAADGIMIEMAASPVHVAIDQATVDWSIAKVRFALG